MVTVLMDITYKKLNTDLSPVTDWQSGESWSKL